MLKRALSVVIPFAAIAIVAATWWRMSIDDDLPRGRSGSDIMRLAAPSFELFDQNRHMVKLERYFSRSAILLVFFNPTDDVSRHELLTTLAENYAAIESRGVVVVGVTTLTPAALHAQTTAQGKEFPFPIVSDIELDNPHPAPTHALYGLYDAETQVVGEGVFYIDQRGTVRSTIYKPLPVEDPQAFIDSLIAGEELEE